jgi:predicted nuclease of restriction endonuclease-like (RecB) superfamily
LTLEFGQASTLRSLSRAIQFCQGFTGAYSERDLESAILREIEGVLLELGTGFAFVARACTRPSNP